MSLILLDIRGLDLIFCYNLGYVRLTIQNGGEQMKYIHPTSGIFINYLFGQSWRHMVTVIYIKKDVFGI